MAAFISIISYIVIIIRSDIISNLLLRSPVLVILVFEIFLLALWQ